MRLVRAITLGRACGAQGTVLALLVSEVFAKSQPPAPGERIRFGGIESAAAGGAFKLPAIPQEVGVATKIFPGESGRVERSKVLVRARRPPVRAAHGLGSTDR